ncbi:MAG: hypothetical protein WCA90_09805 [Ilumatobacteraceae bacterium]
MQDRYTDDVGQFLKMALMRWLTSPSPYGQGHRLGIIWLQEPDAHQRVDDDHLTYLHSTHDADEDLRSLDPELFDHLRQMAARQRRPLSVRETCGLLPTDAVCFDRPLRFDDLVRNDRAARVVGRQRWFHEAMVAVGPCSLVFLDSDDGLERDASQLSWGDEADGGVWMSEVERLLERGQSVVTHQLVDPSKGLPKLIETHMSDIHETLGAEPLTMAQHSEGCVRLFTVIPHQRHRSDLQDRIGALQLSTWGDEFRVYRRRHTLVTV